MITRLIAKRVFNLFIHFGFIFADEALPPAARQSCNLHKRKRKDAIKDMLSRGLNEKVNADNRRDALWGVKRKIEC